MNDPHVLRVFVVEDDLDTLQWLQTYLESEGYEVMTAQTKSEAITQFPTSGCQILLSDLGLPDGTGWDLVGQLKNSPPFTAVAMSGYGSLEDASRSKKAGFSYHLVKPFDPSQLESVLRDIVQLLNLRSHHEPA